jgi:hypothetical protein
MADGRQCTRCGTWYPAHVVAVAFTIKRAVGLMHQPQRDTICRPCQQTARDQRKLRNRWAVKARDVIRRHAIRLEITKQDLIDRYGWDPDRLAHDAEFQYGNGCNYCGHQYSEMGHGLADISLDIMDRTAAPYYRSNTKWCCQTCNRQKGDKSPEWFEINRQVYEAWQRSKTMTPSDLGLLF